MDRTSGTTVSPSRSSSANRDTSARTTICGQDDDLMMSAFTNLNLHPPSRVRGPAHDDPVRATAVFAASVASKYGPEQRVAGGVAGKPVLGPAAAGGATVDPAWRAAGARTAAAPGGLQQHAPIRCNAAVAPVPRPTRSNPSPPRQSAQSGQQTGPNNGYTSVQNKRDPDRKEQHQATAMVTCESERSPTAGPESSRRHSQAERVRGEEDSAPAPPAKVASNREAGSVAGRAAHRQEASATAGADVSRQRSRPKRSRDEEPAMESASSAQSDASGQPLAAIAGMMGVLRRMARTGSEPLSKKSKANLSESNPSQTLVPTRGRYRIVHHRAIPKHGQCVARRKSRHVSAAGERRDVKKNIQFFGDLPERISFSAKNKDPASPPLVVLDGSNVAFAYREGDGRWFAQGPLLSLQFFEQRGVKSVAFVPRVRVRSVTPQDDCCHAFQEAKTSGTISMVPAEGNDDLFILKHAIDKKAYVVTNDRFRDHADNSETLAALGQTKAELRAYLSHYHVCYTFARDEFVPDPEAPLIRMLTQQASDERREKEAGDGGGAKPAVLLLTAPPVA